MDRHVIRWECADYGWLAFLSCGHSRALTLHYSPTYGLPDVVTCEDCAKVAEAALAYPLERSE